MPCSATTRRAMAIRDPVDDQWTLALYNRETMSFASSRSCGWLMTGVCVTGARIDVSTIVVSALRTYSAYGGSSLPDGASYASSPTPAMRPVAFSKPS